MEKKNSPKHKIIISAVQMNSIDQVKKNLDNLTKMLSDIKSDIVVLPELFNFRSQGAHKVSHKESLGDHTIKWLKNLAKEKSITVIAGSIIEKTVSEKSYNTMVVINADGNITNIYRKMHLFDADLGDKKIMESNRFIAGDRPQIISVGEWKIGLSICYDLRFPELYRWYFKQNVDAVVIPSSFTYKTGAMHWHVLCRARAIENQMYVIAPNQIGIGAGNERTYGHSLIIDPYGEILAEMNDEDEGVITVELNKDLRKKAKKNMQIINHIRPEYLSCG